MASALALCLALPQLASASSLSGQVTDVTGQAPFAGAVVRVEEIDRSVVTDRFGRYRLNGLESGAYTISIKYLGTPTVTQTVSIPEADAIIDFTIGDDVAYEDNIIVVGTKAAQASALNQQRAATSIKTIIDSDGLGNFPDTTVADSLSRAVGISVETDQGEGRYVSIRGINTDLISSSINGVRTPSPEDRRGVLLDGVPSDLLDGIEVQKSLTPDVDADSLGGVINLKTVSAFDRKDDFFRVKVEGAYNEITEEVSPKASMTYSNTWDDRFGAAVSLSYQNLAIEAHNNEIGEWDQDDDGNFFVADDYEQRWYDLTRERIGLVANFDWNVNDGTKLYLRTLYNRYTDNEVRNKFELREFDEEIIDVTPTSTTIRRGEVDAEVRLREEVRNIQTYSLGGETVEGPWTVDYQASFAYAEEDDTNNHDVTFRSTPEQRDSTVGAITLSYDDPQQPVISGSALPFLLDPTNYELDAYEQEFTINEDTEYAAQINVSRDSMIGQTPVVWKAGAKYRDRQKTRDQNLTFHERDDVVLDQFIRSDADISNWRLANRMFEWPDANLTASLRDTFQPAELVVEDTLLESSVGDFQVDERILAAYGMGTFEIGGATFVAGVRLEQTDVDLLGNFFEEDSLTATPREISQNYTDILPSINLRYDFTDRITGRAAYYAAVVRPAFGDMAPTALLNDDRDEIELGNPDLEAYGADNFDVGIEFYPTNLSVISIGAFYKAIDNAIFPAEFDIADVPATIDLSFLPAATLATIEDVNTFINVGSSEIFGVEVNYVQNMGDLSESLDGFLFSTNLTLTDSEATLPDGRKVPFLKQSNTVWNIALAYEKGPIDLRVSGNYRGDFLDELQGPELDRYADDRFRIEASAKYRVTPQLQVYLEGKNLTDAPEYFYFGDESRLSQYDEFGRTIVFGARFTY
ncbi:TonB-dependent receptor [Algimonas arctica]|nr:TonB-dependent receptor [Algimonas arctica]